MATTETQFTDEDLWYFKTIGYYRVHQTLPEDLIDRLNQTTDIQIENMVEPLVWEDENNRRPETLRRLSKIFSRDPVYREAASHPIILDALEHILGPNIELITNKHNHIMVRPGGSYPVPWHSGEEPYAFPLITGLIYLEESTMDNGCIRIVSGSHNRPFRQKVHPAWALRSQEARDNFYDSDHYHRSVPIPMPRGGVLLFNDCCFHGSDTNDTSHSRRSMTVAYRAHDTKNVQKEDPEKILIRGERVYEGHPYPFTDLAEPS